MKTVEQNTRGWECGVRDRGAGCRFQGQASRGRRGRSWQGDRWSRFAWEWRGRGVGFRCPHLKVLGNEEEVAFLSRRSRWGTELQEAAGSVVLGQGTCGRRWGHFWSPKLGREVLLSSSRWRPGCCGTSHGARGRPPRPGVSYPTPWAQSAEAEVPWARFSVCSSRSGSETSLTFCFRFYSWWGGFL